MAHGLNNTASALNSGAMGGSGDTVSDNQSFLGGGTSNSVTGASACITCGTSNLLSGATLEYSRVQAISLGRTAPWWHAQWPLQKLGSREDKRDPVLPMPVRR